MATGSNIEQIGFVEFPPPEPETHLPEAWLRFFENDREELQHLFVGEEVQLLIWSSPGDSQVVSPERMKAMLAAAPRALRVHRVHVIAKEPSRLRVRGLQPKKGMSLLEVTSVLERGPTH